MRTKALIFTLLVAFSLGFLQVQVPSAREAGPDFPIQASLDKIFFLVQECAVGENPHRDRAEVVSSLSRIVERGVHHLQKRGEIGSDLARDVNSRLMEKVGSFEAQAMSGAELADEVGILREKVKEKAPQAAVALLEDTALGQAIVDNSRLLGKRPRNLRPEEVSALVKSISTKAREGFPAVGNKESTAVEPESQRHAQDTGASLFQGKWKDPDQRSLLEDGEKKKN